MMDLLDVHLERDGAVQDGEVVAAGWRKKSFFFTGTEHHGVIRGDVYYLFTLPTL